MKIAIVDYGTGNLRSVGQAVKAVADGADVLVTQSAAEIDAADRVIFPGQGAMGDCMRCLGESGLKDAVLRALASKPVLAVCIGMQMLFERSDAVGLRGAADLMPSAISGGMARRVALARAIALDPALIMYDEPFAGLDPISMGITAQLIRKLTDALQATAIIVTHDVAETFEIADYVYMVNAGRIAAQGTPEELTASTDPYVCQFLKGLPDGPVAFHYPAKSVEEEFGVRS